MVTKKIFIDIDFKDFGQQKVLKILLNKITVQEISMSLLLLKENLISNLELIFNNFSFHLTLSNKKKESVLKLINDKEKKFKGQITLDSLEYILYFCLKYYRDGIGEADHIDVDFYNDKEECTLTFKCDSYTEHTPEELSKFLDI